MDGYNCDCASGYTGGNCQTDIDECRGNPCMNGATCTVKHRSYYVIAVIYDITCMIPLLVTFCDITCNVLFLIIFNVLFLTLQLRTQWALIIVPVLKTIKEVLASMMLMSV